jgi:hypothetical protein
VIVTDPGRKKHSTDKTVKGKQTGKSTCATQSGIIVPCHDPSLGDFNNSSGCYYKLHRGPYRVTDDPTLRPPPGKKGGAWYDINCLSAHGTPKQTVIDWFPTPPIQQFTVTPAELAQQAMAELKIPHPTTGRGPGGTLHDGRPYSLVRAYTWFWTDPGSYKPLNKYAAAGPVWATVTVTPSSLAFTPGDGSKTVSCSGPGTPWAQGRNSPWSPSPGGCDYSYHHSTFGAANAELTATYGIVWKATWVGSGGAGGTFPDIITTSQSTFAVAEAEAVVVK